MKKIGVVFSGCGVLDGSEIHEAVLTLLALANQGAEAICFAPNKLQCDVINHITGELMMEKRNVLVEASRIARGDIQSLSQADANKLDGLIVPGGLGATKNLSSFESQGSACKVDDTLKELAQNLHISGKPLGFICIAPVMLPKIFNFPVRLTIGTNLNTAKVIKEMGGKHVSCQVNDIIVDEYNKIVTTPAYMLTKSIAHVALGIEKLVKCVLALTP